jgi:hypothetical protein
MAIIAHALRAAILNHLLSIPNNCPLVNRKILRLSDYTPIQQEDVSRSGQLEHSQQQIAGLPCCHQSFPLKSAAQNPTRTIPYLTPDFLFRHTTYHIRYTRAKRAHLRKGVAKTYSKTHRFLKFLLKTLAFLADFCKFLTPFPHLARRTCAFAPKTCAFALNFAKKLARLRRKLAHLRAKARASELDCRARQAGAME